MNELISNALKHAFPGDRRGEILVALTQQPAGETVLTVRDNGIGVADSIDLAKTNTLGLQLVTLLAEQLGGGVAMNRSHPTEFTLTFTVET